MLQLVRSDSQEMTPSNDVAWPNHLTFLFEVHEEMIRPVRARRGEFVAVCPGHATLPVIVSRRVDGKYTAIDIGPADYAGIEAARQAGIIKQIYPASAFASDAVVYHTIRAAEYSAERCGIPST